MRACAILTRDDLHAVIDEITPLDVELSRRPRRSISFGRPSKVELVADAGLRVRGDARFAWDVAGVTVPVTLRAWQILLVPSIDVREGAHVLAFEPVLEQLDFAALPGFIDAKLRASINEGLAAQKRKVAWNFTKTLGFARSLGEKVKPESRFVLSPTSGRVQVTAEEMTLTVEFAAHVLRVTPVRARDADAPQSPPSRRSA